MKALMEQKDAEMVSLTERLRYEVEVAGAGGDEAIALLERETSTRDAESKRLVERAEAEEMRYRRAMEALSRDHETEVGWVLSFYSVIIPFD